MYNVIVKHAERYRRRNGGLVRPGRIVRSSITALPQFGRSTRAQRRISLILLVCGPCFVRNAIVSHVE
jgi:hypothetical protein